MAGKKTERMSNPRLIQIKAIMHHRVEQSHSIVGEGREQGKICHLWRCCHLPG